MLVSCIRLAFQKLPAALVLVPVRGGSSVCLGNPEMGRQASERLHYRRHGHPRGPEKSRTVISQKETRYSNKLWLTFAAMLDVSGAFLALIYHGFIPRLATINRTVSQTRDAMFECLETACISVPRLRFAIHPRLLLPLRHLR